MRTVAGGQEFISRRLKFQAEVEAAGEPVLRALASLPTVLAWGIARMLSTGSDEQIDKAIIGHAIIHSRHVLVQMRGRIAEIRDRQRRAAVDRHAARMLDRLRVRGPLTRRELVRGFDCQRSEVHEPVIRSLIEQGLVREDGRRLLLGERAGKDGVLLEPVAAR